MPGFPSGLSGFDTPDVRLGGLITGPAYQADPGEEENSPQNAVHNDRLNVFGAFSSIGKNNGGYNETDDPQNGQRDSQYSFFHILSLGDLSIGRLSLLIQSYNIAKGMPPIFVTEIAKRPGLFCPGRFALITEYNANCGIQL